MRLALLGLPGSGKSTLAKMLSQKLNLPHIEADLIFWQGLDLRSETENLITQSHWIYEGHMGKVGDIVLPKADAIIFVDHPEISCLLRTLKRKRTFKRKFHNILHFYLIRDRMQELVKGQKNLIHWRCYDPMENILKNLPDPGQGLLATFGEKLKAPILHLR